MALLFEALKKRPFSLELPTQAVRYPTYLLSIETESAFHGFTSSSYPSSSRTSSPTSVRERTDVPARRG
jgi:hypothetical protein